MGLSIPVIRILIFGLYTKHFSESFDVIVFKFEFLHFFQLNLILIHTKQTSTIQATYYSLDMQSRNETNQRQMQ